MNETRFRFWDIPTKEMSPREWTPTELMEAAIRTGHVLSKEHGVWIRNTGIKDIVKDKRELFFGDIVRYSFTDKDEPEANEQNVIAEIVETMGGGAGVLVDGVINDIWDDPALWQVEIIGDIYRNPELSYEARVEKENAGRGVIKSPIQQCGECGSINNAIVAQCMKCGCAVCEKCTTHESKC